MADKDGEKPAPRDATPAPEKPSATDRSLLQIVFPDQANKVMVLAVGIGLLLIAAGFAGKIFYDTSAIQANVVLAIGAGILLAAFGGQASARFGPFVLAGVVAITTFFVYWLDRAEKMKFEREQTSLISGRISGVNLRTFQITIKNDDYAYSRNDAREYDFVIPRRNLRNEITLVTIQPRNEGGTCPTVFTSEDCTLVVQVPRKSLEAASAGDPVEWRFDIQQGVLRDLQNNDISEQTVVRDFAGEDDVQAAQTGLGLFEGLFVGVGHAQPAAIERPEDLKRLLHDLVSNDAEIRRLARDDLSDGPLSWVAPIADRLVTDFDEYRIRIGSVVALAQMLRENKKRVSEVQAQLTQRHLASLLRAVADKDRTVRIYAGEFLIDLSDPRAVQPAMQMATAVQDDNALYNLVLVVRAGVSSLNQQDRAAVIKALRALRGRVGEKTKQQIDIAIKQAS